jgi:hypothetical protein
MKFKIRCKFCGGEHRNITKNFPLALYEKREVFEGRDKKKKSLGIKPALVGYACRKCIGRHERDEFIKQHSIKPAPGQSIMDAVRSKIKDLKMKPKYVPPPQQKPKLKSGWEKTKDRVKQVFFKKRGRE